MIEFHEQAIAEAREAQAWYAVRSRRAAESVRSQLRVSIGRIIESPDQFANIRKNYKYARIFGFPYTVVFRRKSDGTLLVVVIAHTSRSRGYWSDRD